MRPAALTLLYETCDPLRILQDTPFSIDELKVLLTDKLAKYEMPTEMEMGASPPKAPVKN